MATDLMPPRCHRLMPHLLARLDEMVEQGQGRVSAQQLARDLNTDVNTVTRTLTGLVRAGRIVRPYRHSGGQGHRLSRDAEGVFHFDRSAPLQLDRPMPAGCSLRPCLRCRQAFASEGVHNRLCEACRAYAAQQVDTTVPVTGLGRTTTSDGHWQRRPRMPGLL